MDYNEQSLALHRNKKGKIEIRSKVSLTSREDLSVAYTPGVAAVSLEIARHPETVREYTIKGNTVAVVTDGTAVLGLGDIGPEAALPVMEGKALLFKEFANIDAFPICLATKDTEKIIETVKNIAPSFGGINLEDISSPRCFEIEARLQDIGIPVFHDDQHGTAIVVLAALLNAAKVVGKRVEDLRVVINGTGAAGIAIMKLLSCIEKRNGVCIPVADIIMGDSQGIIHPDRIGLPDFKKEIANATNLERRQGTLADAVKDFDVFIGVSKGNLLTVEMVKTMAEKSIVFAMANPTPEIDYHIAKEAGAKVVATGRSDFPNQVNNVLAFPGIFRGALDIAAPRITEEMKLRAVYALAKLVESPTEEYILPSPLDKRVASAVAEAVKSCES